MKGKNYLEEIVEEYEEQVFIEKEIEEEEEISVDRYDIWSNLIQPNVDLIIKYLDEGRIKIPNFQRAYRWSLEKASKFIESILVGLPIPPVFFSRNPNNEYLVIDGQQRLLTLYFFYKGFFPKLERELPVVFDKEKNAKKIFELLKRKNLLQAFKLKNVKRKWADKSYKDLNIEDKNWLGGYPIWAIVIEQRKPSNDNSSIYYIFQRLNTGGEVLSPMEIRKVIFYGPFIEDLEKLNTNIYWRKIYGKQYPDIKLIDLEVLLRIIALYECWENYQKPMKEFLNKFLSKNRKKKIPEFKKIFELVSKLIIDELGEKPFHFGNPKRRNIAFMDSFFVGALKYYDKIIKTPNILKKIYEDLKKDKKFIEMIKVRNPTETKDLKQRINYVLINFEKRIIS